MNIPPAASGLTGYTAPQLSGVAVRILSGELPLLALGETVQAVVQGVRGSQALVELNGVQLLIDTTVPLQPGTQLPLRLAGLLPQPRLEVPLKESGGGTNGSAAQTPVRTDSPTPPVPEEALPAEPNAPSVLTQITLAELPQGQALQATVTGQLANGRLLLDVQGTRVEATTTESLPTGTRLQVQTAHTPNGVSLEIVESTPPVEHLAALLLHSLTEQGPAGNGLEKLRAAVTSLTQEPTTTTGGQAAPNLEPLKALLNALLPAEGTPDAEQLARFVATGGTRYEARLAQATQPTAEGEAATAAGPRLVEVARTDLKGVLLQTLNDLGSASAKNDSPVTALQKLAQAVAQQLDAIESGQVVNVLGRTQGEAYRFQAPVTTPQGVVAAAVSVDTEGDGGRRGRGDGSNNGERRGHRVLLAVHLSELGPTRIDARFAGRAMDVTLYVEKAAAKARLTAEAPSLHEALQGLGYDRVNVTVRSATELSADNQRQFTALAAGVPSSIQLVDAKA